MQDLDVGFKCYEWPSKMAAIMKDAISKANSEHKLFEVDLKNRRKEFGDSLSALQERVDAFEKYDVTARRSEHAKEVTFSLISLPISEPFWKFWVLCSRPCMNQQAIRIHL